MAKDKTVEIGDVNEEDRNANSTRILSDDVTFETIPNLEEANAKFKVAVVNQLRVMDDLTPNGDQSALVAAVNAVRVAESAFKAIMVEKVIDNDSDLTVANLGQIVDIISPERRRELITSLGNNTNLKELLYHSNRMTLSEVNDIAAALSVNTSIIKMNLDYNQFGDYGAIVIANMLRNNGSLINLHLGRNKISYIGAEALAQVLITNNALEELHLNNNPIGRGGIEIGKAIGKNPKLNTLTLVSCEMDDDCAKAIADGIRLNNNLIVLELEHDFEHVLAGNKSSDGRNRVFIHKVGNKFSDEGRHALTEAVNQNQSIIYFNSKKTHNYDKALKYITDYYLDNPNNRDFEIGGTEKYRDFCFRKPAIKMILEINGKSPYEIKAAIAKVDKKFEQHTSLADANIGQFTSHIYPSQSYMSIISRNNNKALNSKSFAEFITSSDDEKQLSPRL